MSVCRSRWSSASTSNDVGFDVKADAHRRAQSRGIDSTLEASKAELKSASQLTFTTDLADLKRCQRFHRHGADADR
jgi:hypothetical protein